MNDQQGTEDKSPSLKKESESKTTRKRRLFLVFLLLLGSIAGVYFGYGWLMFRLQYVSSDDARVKGNLIAISPKIQGKISHIFAEEGDTIEKDQVVAELENEEYFAALKKTKSELERTHMEISKEKTQLYLVRIQVKKRISETKLSISQAEDSLKMAQQEYALQQDVVQKEINKARANFMVAKARVTEEHARLQEANRDFERAKKLFEKGIISESRIENAETNYSAAQSVYKATKEKQRSAESHLELAQAKYRSIEPLGERIHIAEKAFKKAQLELDLATKERKLIKHQEQKIMVLEARAKEVKELVKLAQIDLQETIIKSPIKGILSKKVSNSGEVVQPGQPIVFVNDPEDIWIEANIEETKIRKIKKGAPVIVKVDAYPGRKFNGKVTIIGSATTSQFSLIPSANPSGQFVKVTQRIPVRISVNDVDHLLKPGMMIIVWIKIEGGN